MKQGKLERSLKETALSVRPFALSNRLMKRYGRDDTQKIALGLTGIAIGVLSYPLVASSAEAVGYVNKVFSTGY